MDTQSMRSVLTGLWNLGWAADDWFSGCEVSGRELVDAFEAMVHELAHSVVVSATELQTPKGPGETSKLSQGSESPDQDEVDATAVTILVCRFFGADVRDEASYSLGFNLKDKQLQDTLSQSLECPEVQSKSDLLVEYLMRLV